MSLYGSSSHASSTTKHFTVLPADLNPYLALNGVYKSQLMFKAPQSGIGQLSFLIGIHAVAMILFLLALTIRWWKGIMWGFRRPPSTRLILPNYSVVCSWTAVLILILFEVSLARSVQGLEGWLHKDYGFFVLFCGPSRYLAGQVVLWSLGASIVLQRHHNGSNITFYSHLSNLLGISIPIVTLSISFILALLGGKAYADAVTTYDHLNEFLINQSRDWSSSDLSTQFVPPPNELTTAFTHHLQRIESTWRASFLWQGIAGTVLCIGLVVVGISYLVPMRRDMIKMSTNLGHHHQTNTLVSSSMTVTTTTMMNPCRIGLKPTWTMLVLVLTSFILGFSASSIVDYTIYSRRPFSLNSWTTSLLVLFLPYYLSCVPAVMTGGLAVYMAVKSEGCGRKGVWRRCFDWIKGKKGSTRSGGGGEKRKNSEVNEFESKMGEGGGDSSSCRAGGGRKNRSSSDATTIAIGVPNEVDGGRESKAEESETKVEEEGDREDSNGTESVIVVEGEEGEEEEAFDEDAKDDEKKDERTYVITM